MATYEQSVYYCKSHDGQASVFILEDGAHLEPYGSLSLGSPGTGVVDTFVATPRRFWFGVGNMSVGHWRRNSTVLYGWDRGQSPIKVDTQGATWLSCHWTRDLLTCFSKTNNANGPTRVWTVDDVSGSVETLCPSLHQFPDNALPSSIAFDTASKQFVIVAVLQVNGSIVEKLYSLPFSSCIATELNLLFEDPKNSRIDRVWVTVS